MNTLRAIPLALLLAFTPFASSEDKCQFISCKGTECGCELRKKGWKEVARCEGHEWSYLLEKNSSRKLCTGIAGFAGYLEHPCSPFQGNLEEFKKCSKSK